MTGKGFPDVYLGMNFERCDDKNKLYLSCHDYITNVINRVKKIVEKECLKTYDSVAKDNLKSELDELSELDKRLERNSTSDSWESEPG